MWYILKYHTCGILYTIFVVYSRKLVVVSRKTGKYSYINRKKDLSQKLGVAQINKVKIAWLDFFY
jgi:hypothetical protein